MEELDALTRLAEELSGRHTLEALLQLIADRSAEILDAQRVSVRLLNPTHTHLLAVARAGQPLHDRPQEFRVGEGLVGKVAATGEVIVADEPERHPAYVARPGMSGSFGAFLGVPIKSGASVTGVLSVVSAERKFTESDAKLLRLVAALAGPWVEMARLARLSQVDPLTGMLNRRGLDESFPEVTAGAPGPIMPLTVVLADVDHFKRVNDEHGHAVGDLVLRQIATILGGVVREGDAVVRYGGEEILLVLPRVGREQGVLVAERARVAVRMSSVKTPAGSVSVTLSFGVAERREGETREALLARADEALYRAKAMGRDRVIAS